MDQERALTMALFEATRVGNIEFLSQALAAFPDALTVEDDDEDSLLHAACYNNKPNAIRFLVEKGLDVDTVGCSARMPIDCAAHQGYFDCVKVLLEYKPDIDWGDALNENTIHKAAARGHCDVLRLVLESRRPSYDVINRQNVLGSTPLHLAMDRGHAECAELLLRFGADPKIEDYFGYLPTMQPKWRPSPQKFSYQ